jgi:hypothetical protein
MRNTEVLDLVEKVNDVLLGNEFTEDHLETISKWTKIRSYSVPRSRPPHHRASRASGSSEPVDFERRSRTNREDQCPCTDSRLRVVCAHLIHLDPLPHEHRVMNLPSS